MFHSDEVCDEYCIYHVGFCGSNAVYLAIRIGLNGVEHNRLEPVGNKEIEQSKPVMPR